MQLKHELEDDSAEYLPAGQLEQADPAVAYLPAEHEAHEVDEAADVVSWVNVDAESLE